MAGLARAICHTKEKNIHFFFLTTTTTTTKKNSIPIFYFNSIEFHGRLENNLVLSRLTPLRSTGFDQRTWPVEEDEDDQSPPPLL
jgi:hypothetical protein